MELPVANSFRTLCRASLCSSVKLGINRCFSYHPRFPRRWNRASKRPLRVSVGLERDFSFNEDRNVVGAQDDVGFCEDSELLEVIGIGSRRDAVLDFCLESPFKSTSRRFWNILKEDSMKVLLQQRLLETDITPRVVEALLSLQSCFNAIILVAGAASGSDLATAIEILRKTRSAKGLAVALIMKPFRFEGQQRHDEVMYVVNKLQEHTNFYIEIDMDRLLQKNLVTLDEALRTAKDAVVLALNAIAVLISRRHKKYVNVLHDKMKELKLSHIVNIMESCKEAKVGFGVGYNISSSIIQAIYDCPFLSVSIKDLNGTVICVLASSGVINKSDANAFLQTLRQATKCQCEMVISTIEEPSLEPNLIVSTVFILGCTGKQASPKGSIFARLADHFPFVFNLVKEHDQESKRTQGSGSHENPCTSNKTNLSDPVEMPKRFSEGGRAEWFDTYSEELHELQTLLSSNNDQIYALRSGMVRTEVGFLEDKCQSSNCYDQNIEGHRIAQEWAKERAANSNPTPVLDNPTVRLLPVGIRPSEELKDSSNMPNTTAHLKQISGADMTTQSLVAPRMSSYVPKKQGILSVRAASMLESERDSGKSWNRIMEIEYRGGVYDGRCQGGLPEGKGRLSYGDGSIYDGMWRSGKRSGLGIFYYNNGDVFQGSWRDDLMHGKGWFYFHSGDRWFANFWKGKANGEGHFYSKVGDIFFGHFQDGWRHGHFLGINVDGIRFVEIWDGGVLVSRDQLD